MAKPRQARLTVKEVGQQPDLDDESPQLWREDLPEVARNMLTSAVRCFATNGFHGTTTRDIPGMLGLSPASLYVYFPSKANVLFEIIRTGHERVLEHITTPELDQLDSATRLRTLVARYTEWHARHHVAARVSQYDFTGLKVEDYDVILELRQQTSMIFRNAVQAGVDDGSFADVDVQRVARAILSLGIDLVRWYRLDGSDSPEQVAAFNADLALKMVT